MKLALLSDIHGNYVALEKCLNYIADNNFDGVVFLGDYITDCPYPQRTIELVKQTASKYTTWCIRGNREENMLNHKSKPQEWTYDSRSGNLLNTYSQLSDEDLSFFESMPITDTVRIEKCTPFTICHGSPGNIGETLFANEENTRTWLENTETDYLFCGHTHKLFMYEYRGKNLVSCGSVGLPTNGQTDTQFARIEFINDKWEIDFVSLPYYIDRLLYDFEISGIYTKYPWWAKSLSQCLKTGINYPYKVLIRASEIANKNNETLSEHHWQQAANEFGIY